MEALKRQALAIEAMRHVTSPMRLVLVGRGPDERSLREQAERLGVADRVAFEIGISDERLRELYLGAAAVYYGPFDEDYGYVTLEGFAARRPVVTLTDSGGPLELVEDDVTGVVVPPEPPVIGGAFDRLARAPHVARPGGGGRGRAPAWRRRARTAPGARARLA
jgi:glycosyltransferase involved in cell wall biosynthesis